MKTLNQINNEALQNARECCERRGYELLYFARIGSYLYGTNTDKSDHDFRGIYMPSLEQLVVSGGYETKAHDDNTNNKTKNTSNDVDISLWSIHHFLKLLSKGDTGALDLLFSMRSQSKIFSDIPELEARADEFFNPYQVQAMIGFAHSQAKKYTNKIENLHFAQEVLEHLHSEEYNPMEIPNVYEHLSKRFPKVCQFENGVFTFFGKNIGASTKGLMVRKLETIIKSYGDRVKTNDRRVDYKSYYHAVRCVLEANEVMSTGWVNFPLQQRDFLLRIKAEHYEQDWLDDYIKEEISKLPKQNEEDSFPGNINETHKKFLLHLYFEREELW